MAKRYEELTISDDFIFGKTMGADAGKTGGNTGRYPATEGIPVCRGW